ncbi:L-gulonolactone oxidase 2 [Folsomia candida]|uniref:L-gulonolactone oxidase 2 n=1 Tax=Folsomia candida TaxID=158441 RepID=A0A226F146_FOLCA|nr:L-gulonolactone oxidase 2 [Folsomia candida]
MSKVTNTVLLLQMFVLSSTTYKSYQTSIHCTPSEPIHYPKSTEEVVNIVKRAIGENKTVKAFGSRHSITDIICTDGYPVSMKHFDHAIDNEDGTATFGAGIELQDAMIFLEKNGRTLISLPTFGGITLGGAIGTGAHGSSLLHPTSISDQVVRLTLVDGRGSLRDVSDPNELNALRVNLGLFGVIIDVTLQTVPLFKMTVHNRIHADHILTDGRTALRWAAQHDLFQIWWFPSQGDVVVSKGIYHDGTNELGNDTTNFIPDTDFITRNLVGTSFETLQETRNTYAMYLLEAYTKFSLVERVVGRAPIFEEHRNNGSAETWNNFKNPATGFSWRLMSNRCQRSCTWNTDSIRPKFLIEESSIAFDLEEFSSVINMIRKVLRQYPAAFPLVGLFIRFSIPSDGLMAISSNRSTFTVEWTTPMRWNRYEKPKDGIGAYQWILQEMVQNYNGRPHWGKNGLHYFNRDLMASVWKDKRELFVESMTKYDPEGIFLNKFGRRLLGTSDQVDKDSKVYRCALQDYCICQKHDDCGLLQNCVNRNGFNICKDLIDLKLPIISIVN